VLALCSFYEFFLSPFSSFSRWADCKRILPCHWYYCVGVHKIAMTDAGCPRLLQALVDKCSPSTKKMQQTRRHIGTQRLCSAVLLFFLVLGGVPLSHQFFFWGRERESLLSTGVSALWILFGLSQTLLWF
jgi:hypothetical protein